MQHVEETLFRDEVDGILNRLAVRLADQGHLVETLKAQREPTRAASAKMTELRTGLHRLRLYRKKFD